MDDLISREAAIEAMRCINDSICEQQAVDALILLPTAEKVGKWIEHEWAEEYDGKLISNYECSECNSWERERTNYCPNCGARMVEGEEDDSM